MFLQAKRAAHSSIALLIPRDELALSSGKRAVAETHYRRDPDSIFVGVKFLQSLEAESSKQFSSGRRLKAIGQKHRVEEQRVIGIWVIQLPKRWCDSCSVDRAVWRRTSKGVWRWSTILLGFLVVGFVSRLVVVWMFSSFLALMIDRTLNCFPSFTIFPRGHTAEILRIVEKVDFEIYSPRCLITAVTGDHSLAKAKRFEEEKPVFHLKYRYYRIHGSREVGSSYITLGRATLFAVALYLAFSILPDLISH
ncbi:hypothetical protein R1sor_026901 [Riccia sorocarpa]|uniref:UDP-N-acetylglucosamine transferase subunit ALG14 n=1 Tax=Riccia sorocarpa TaxID=122646 RepID=A0ABD3GCR5_9MARC